MSTLLFEIILQTIPELPDVTSGGKNVIALLTWIVGSVSAVSVTIVAVLWVKLGKRETEYNTALLRKDTEYNAALLKKEGDHIADLKTKDLRIAEVTREHLEDLRKRENKETVYEAKVQQLVSELHAIMITVKNE